MKRLRYMGQLIKALAQGHLWLDQLLRREAPQRSIAKSAGVPHVWLCPGCTAWRSRSTRTVIRLTGSRDVHGPPWLGAVRPQNRTEVTPHERADEATGINFSGYPSFHRLPPIGTNLLAVRQSSAPRTAKGMKQSRRVAQKCRPRKFQSIA